jgi:hypothetical protein
MRLDRETQSPFSRTELLLQVSELGARLKHLVAQYDRMVRGLAGDETVSADLDSRLHLVDREFGHLARRVQELFVLENEARRQEKGGCIPRVSRRSNEPSHARPAHQSGRASVVTSFVSSAYRQALPATPGATRLAVAR